MSDDTFVRAVKERVDLVALISERVPLKKTGKTWSACCPFHKEKTPSFHVMPDKGRYRCYGCEASGDALSFLMAMDGMDFPQALEELAKREGMEMPRRRRPGRDLSPLRAALEEAWRWYIAQLDEGAGRQARAAMAERLGEEAVTAFGLGYAPAGGGLATELVQAHGPALRELGLVREDERRGGERDLLWDRWIFPICDSGGKIAGFSGRVARDDKKAPKYVNSPQSALFDKSRLIYNLHRVRPQDEQLLVVEGYTDVIRLTQAGFSGVVAVMGTALTEHHFQALFRRTGEVVLCFDGDGAGRKAAWRAILSGAQHLDSKHTLRILTLPEGADPDSLVQEQGAEKMRELMVQSPTLSQFLLDSLPSPEQGGLEQVRAGLERAMEVVRLLPDQASREMWRDALAGKVGVDPASLSVAAPAAASGPAPAQRQSAPASGGAPWPQEPWPEPGPGEYQPAVHGGQEPHADGADGAEAAEQGGVPAGVRRQVAVLAAHMLEILLHHPQLAGDCALTEKVAGWSVSPLDELLDLLSTLRTAAPGQEGQLCEEWKLRRELDGETPLRADQYRGVLPGADDARASLRGYGFDLELHAGALAGESRVQVLCRMLDSGGAEAVPAQLRQDILRELSGALLRSSEEERERVQRALAALRSS